MEQKPYLMVLCLHGRGKNYPLAKYHSLVCVWMPHALPYWLYLVVCWCPGCGRSHPSLQHSHCVVENAERVSCVGVIASPGY